VLCEPLSHARMVSGVEGERDYGTETAVFISALIVLYLLAVVYLVRRQINQVNWVPAQAQGLSTNN
jgi:hypothetical protein